MTKRSWALSLIIHGLLLMLLLTLAVPAAEHAQPIRWQVALLNPAPPEQPSPPPAAATSPRADAAVTPSSVPAPRPTSFPKPIPTPTPPSAPPTPPVPTPVATPAAAALATTEPVAPLSPPAPIPATLPAEVPPPSPVPTRPAVVAAPVTKPAPVKPSPPPQPPVDAESQRRWYAALAAKLAQLKRYPLVARRQGQEGVVLLQALIHPDGLTEVEIKQGSGHPALDRAALALFQEAVLALPEKLSPAQASRLDVPIAYRLEH